MSRKKGGIHKENQQLNKEKPSKKRRKKGDWVAFKAILYYMIPLPTTFSMKRATELQFCNVILSKNRRTSKQTYKIKRKYWWLYFILWECSISQAAQIKNLKKQASAPFRDLRDTMNLQPHLQNWPLNQNHTTGFKVEKLATNPAPFIRVFQDWSKHKNLCELIMSRLGVNNFLRATGLFICPVLFIEAKIQSLANWSSSSQLGS